MRQAGLAAGAVGLLFSAMPTATAVTARGDGPDRCPAVSGYRIDCGTVDRPLVEGKPQLGTIEVSYAVLRHRGPGAAKGTVAVNPGGPGEVAIGRAAEFAEGLKDLLSDHDLLLVDPRGTGQSGQLPCGVGDAQYRFATRQQQHEAVSRCAETLGPRAEGYTSAATADDIDAVRSRLGVAKLSLYGLSYGTYLMPVYASRHPEHVRNIVLSGAYPLAFDPLARPSAQAVSLALHRVCDRAGEGVCDGDTAVEDLATTAARLRDEPLTEQVTVDGTTYPLRFTEDKLANFMYEAASSDVGAAPSEPSLLGRLPSALHRFVGGDDGPLRGLVREGAASATTADQAPFLAVVCNDYRRAWSVDAPLPQRWRQYRHALGAARPGEFGAFGAKGFTEGQTDGGDACITWPREGTARPQPTHPALPDVPVLVLSGDLDANTPDANGRPAARQFRHSTFVSVPNVGHVPDTEPSGCVTGMSTRFIRTGSTGSTACLRDIPPIAVTPVAR
ncbi:alpha/beta hydrolase [Streptomyces griseocarneus]|nr:alpha/beta hydrolase [Streptomyces griseocarneus]